MRDGEVTTDKSAVATALLLRAPLQPLFLLHVLFMREEDIQRIFHWPSFLIVCGYEIPHKNNNPKIKVKGLYAVVKDSVLITKDF